MPCFQAGEVNFSEASPLVANAEERSHWLWQGAAHLSRATSASVSKSHRLVAAHPARASNVPIARSCVSLMFTGVTLSRACSGALHDGLKIKRVKTVCVQSRPRQRESLLRIFSALSPRFHESSVLRSCRFQGDAVEGTREDRNVLLVAFEFANGTREQ